MDAQSYMEKSQAYSDFKGGTHRSQDHLLCAAFGLLGEAGEVADYLKKVAFHGWIMDPKHLMKELGDVCWYVACAADSVGIYMPSTRAPDTTYTPSLDERRWMEMVVKMGSRASTAADHLSAAAFRLRPLNSGTVVYQLEMLMLSVKSLGERFGLGMDEILQGNLDKLAIRYPEGVFSSKRSIARADE